MKYLRVTMPDGSKWDVPARLVASNWALYCANRNEKDTPSEKEMVFNKEFQFLIANDQELFGWAADNMNWEDVEIHAVRVEDGSIDYQEGWVNGSKEIVEYE